MHLFSRVDLSIPPSRRFGVSLGREIEAALQGKIAPLNEPLDRVQLEVHLFSRIFWNQVKTEACSSIFNHALNDFSILLKSLWDGDGRTAARTSRSLFEHLVNYCYVCDETEAADRYTAHRAVTSQVLSRTTKRLPLLRKSQQKREIHRRMKRGRDSLAEYESARTAYGTTFDKDWAKHNLRERAKRAGFESDYDTYRLLSQVTHGSTGGTLGTLRDDSGPTIHRMGPSFELAALAYPEGISYFRDLCQQVQSRNSIDSRRLVAELNALIAGWSIYKQACEWTDRHLWPEKIPLPATTILAIYPNGGTRWFLWEPGLGVITGGTPPDNASYFEGKAKEYLSFVPDGTHLGDPEGRPLTVSVMGISITAIDGSNWVPAEAILQPGRGNDFARAFFSSRKLLSEVKRSHD
ncbi:DUF5677 domain-containing protein [Streptomyces sp. NPDC101118]|uniref:DUF5677 domain-containing protein n=1 Tax=Streptomyces sp. NPDC101118 TaxID=3366109 RepID=UPI00382FB2AC